MTQRSQPEEKVILLIAWGHRVVVVAATVAFELEARGEFVHSTRDSSLSL